MNIGEALTWIVTNPRPLPHDGETQAGYAARRERGEFDYSMMCEALHDEKHDQKANPTN